MAVGGEVWQQGPCPTGRLGRADLRVAQQLDGSEALRHICLALACSTLHSRHHTLQLGLFLLLGSCGTL